MNMSSESNKQFSLLSYEITKSLDSKIIKDNGIYFTPNDVILLCLNKIKKYESEYKIIINEILEPCCGSCEFVLLLDDYFKNKNIDAIENNSDIFKKIKNIQLKNNKLELEHKNFFFKETNKKYDLIIGNPPYYVLSKNDISEKYFKYFDGRPNIFVLFIIECLKKLNKNGILCFVLPINFMNCIYYDKTRKYIKCNYTILDITFFKDSKFLNTRQDVFIMIVQNSIKNNDKFTLNIGGYTIFNEEEKIEKLKKLYEKSTNLNKLNFKVSVGNVIWNENKSILTDDNSKTLLIYSGYISENELVIKKFNNELKKNYINKKGINELCVVINRGYGKGNYKFSYALVDIENDYLIENHLLVIKYCGNKSKEEIRNLYEKIIESFSNEKTEEFISIYFGNNALNTNELIHILPIYL
jgi:tRNA1(Val) A37 N6-methylase TrmN6